MDFIFDQLQLKSNCQGQVCRGHVQLINLYKISFAARNKEELFQKDHTVKLKFLWLYCCFQIIILCD